MRTRRREVLVAAAVAFAIAALGVQRAIDVIAGSRDDEMTMQSPANGKVPLRVSRRNPIPGERIAFTGQLDAAVARPVVLQARGPVWTTVAVGHTDSDGRFSLSTSATGSPLQYRVRAPRLTAQAQRAGSHAAQVSMNARVTPVEQAAEFALAPAPVGQSERGLAGLRPAAARFTPPRAGRTVRLERRSGRLWETVATSTQDARGKVLFNVDTDDSGRSARYRAVAGPRDGAPEAASDAAVLVTERPVWRDEFNGDGLDTSIWNYRHLGARSEASQRRCAESSQDTVSVSGGKAHLEVDDITPREDPAHCPHGEYLNAHIGTQGTFSFTYGVLAARIKFPRQRGQHGALWSQPTDPQAVPGNPKVSGAEIDVVEYFGDDFRSGALQHSVYWTGPGGQPKKVGGARNRAHLLGPGKTWSNSFHVYSVEWTPNEYIFRIDGHQTFRTSRGVSGTPQYVILSLLTSDWELEHMKAEALDAMEVDWVRVWEPELR